MDFTLPQRLYLLNFDLEKNKPDSNTALVRGNLMRGAAVADLVLAGLLRDEGGKAVRTGGAAPEDPFLAEVLDAAAPGEPQRWFSVVDRHWHKAEAAVRDGLEGRGAVRVDRGRALGVFPTARPSLTDPDSVTGLRGAVRGAALAGRNPAGVPADVAVLAALAVDGDVCCTVARKERRAHKPEIALLRDHVDALMPGVRKATGLSMTARRTGAA